MYSLVKETWELCGKHIREDVPSKYVFMLQCCFEDDCINPVCQEGKLKMRQCILVAPVLLLSAYLFQILRAHSMVATVATVELIIAMGIT